MSRSANERRPTGANDVSDEGDYTSARNLLELTDHLERGGKVSINSIKKRCGVSQGTAKKYLAFWWCKEIGV